MRRADTLYRGERLEDADGITARVTANGWALSPAASLRLRRHSPTGFEWGYLGSGPAQLALSLLLDATSDRAVALRRYHQFKWEVVQFWTRDSWVITAGEIRAWVDRCEREERQREEASEPIRPFVVAEGGAP